MESFGLVGVLECGIARWKFLSPKEVKGFNGPPPYDSCRAAIFSGIELALKGDMKTVDNFDLRRLPKDAFWVINYLRWIKVRIGSSMNLSRSHYGVFFDSTKQEKINQI